MSIICLAYCIAYIFCIFSRFIMFIICVIYVHILCYVILCYAMVGCCAVSCPKNFSAQSDSVFFCASDK